MSLFVGLNLGHEQSDIFWL